MLIILILPAWGRATNLIRTMSDLISFISYVVILFCVILIIVLSYYLVVGKISLKKLLLDKNSGNLSQVRLQQFIVSIFIAVYFIWYSTKNGRFPEIDYNLLLLFAGSSSFYLGGKMKSLKTFQKYKKLYQLLRNQLKRSS